jgi:predicted RNase H-like nuclease (RuvC/YqgF family)
MHLIVGIDTGKTVAIACLDLNGSLVHSSHAASAGIGWLVSSIRAAGVPDIIATDKPDTGSDIIKKVNAAFNSTLYFPRRNIPLREKKLAAKAKQIKNPHERDAYMAALKAYNAYANKLNQAEHLAREQNFADIDVLKSKVIHRYSIDEAVRNRKAHRR